MSKPTIIIDWDKVVNWKDLKRIMQLVDIDLSSESSQKWVEVNKNLTRPAPSCFS